MIYMCSNPQLFKVEIQDEKTMLDVDHRNKVSLF